MYNNPTGLNGMSNIRLLTEDNFSVVPDNTLIWHDKLPFKKGDLFPTPFIQNRANLFKTNTALYRGKYEGIMDGLLSINDSLVDAITKYPILRVIPKLPDYSSVTDTWVDLLAAKPPKIDGSDASVIGSVSSIVGASNFARAYQAIVRGSLIMYGNAVMKVDRQTGGNPKIVEMPLKTWIPFVNEKDITAIDVNCFFNIVEHDVHGTICEFMLYHEDGKEEKITFKYDARNKKLGDQVDYEDGNSFAGKGVSPIVVFTGSSIGNTVYGESTFNRWEPAITSSIRAYQTILILLERTKEMIRVIPEGATSRDENTGVTFYQQTGAIGYRHNPNEPNSVPEVKYVVPEIKMTEAIAAYKESLVRLSRDTDLAYAIYDTKELGSQMSAKALKTNMYKTELKAKSMTTLISHSTKLLIVKIALSVGIVIDMADFSLKTESGFVQDIETMTSLVQQRNGGKVTLSVADSISVLDDVTMAEAEAIERQLAGLPEMENTDVSATDSGEDSEVSEVALTHQALASSDVENRSSATGNFYPTGGISTNV